MTKLSVKVAFCGMMAALTTVLMVLTGFAAVATIAAPAIAGCLLIPVVIEAGLPWAFATYGVCSGLSLLLVPDRQAALIYILFFGYYPVLYALLGKISKKPLRYAAKLAVFNIAVAAEVLLSVYVLSIPVESFFIFGKYTPAILLVLANIVFLVYDFALDGLILTYMNRLHPSVERMFRQK